MVSSAPKWKITLSSLFHGLFGYSSFYYLTVLNSMQPWIKDFINGSVSSHYGHDLSVSELNWCWSIVAGSYAIGCVLGAVTLQYPLDRLGRRDTFMLIKNCLVCIAALTQGVSKPSNCFELLLIGRILAGVGMMQTVQVHMFMAECAPTDTRGFVSCLPAIGQRVWLFLGALLSLEMCGAGPDNWHMVLLYPIVPSLLHLLCTPLIPKSPKHLFITEQDQEGAKKSIKFYHGPQADFGKIAREFQNEADASRNIKSASFSEILAHRQMRWPLILSTIGLLMFPLSGADIAVLYSTGIMESIGIPFDTAPLYTVFIIQAPGAIANLVALFLVEKLGRRIVLLTGCTLSTVGIFCLSFTTLALSIANVLSDVLAVLGLALIFVGYSVGSSLISPLLPGEIAPQASRACSMSFGSALDWTLSLVIAFGYPPASAAIGSYAALPIAVLATLCSIFLAIFLPETKGKSVDEIVARWMD